MRVPSSCFVRRFQKPVFAIALCLLHLSFLHFLGVVGNAQSSSSREQPAKNSSGAKTSKQRGKYDVERIGQRGVGHGINLYSINRERSLGQNLASSLDRGAKFINDKIISDYVNEVGQKIVRNSDAEVPFTIKVIESSDMGAFGLPGGFLYVDSGLITALDGEAELASVMAHEIGHVAARHATRAVTRRRISDLVSTFGLFAGPAGVALQEVGGLGGPLSGKKFSRDAEYEADLLGMEYIYAAGYDPEAFLSALEKLHAHELKMQELYSKIPGYRLGSKVPFHKQIARTFSNYPLTEDRLRRLQEEVSVFLPDRQEYVSDSSEFHEIKARLLASEAPVLRRPRVGADPGKGPVLRRNRD
jgi:predicted Zn-dependent protease